VLAALVAPENEDDRAVVASRPRPPEQVLAAGAREAALVFMVELDAVVAATSRALQAVEPELPGRAREDRVPLGALPHDLETVAGDADVREPREHPLFDHRVARHAEVVDGPETEVHLVARFRFPKDETRALRRVPDDRVTAGPDVSRRFTKVGRSERPDDRANEVHRGIYSVTDKDAPRCAIAMRTVAIARPGGPEVLELTDRPTPNPGPGEVRVRVRAAGVNRADLLQRMGLYPAPPDAPRDVPGLEFAGEIAALGAGVTDTNVGDRVFGLVGGGAYADELVTHARSLSPIPSGMSFTEAAAIPEAFVTAYDAMLGQAELAAGEVVLVQAAGSGVGTAAIQIARAMGARSIATARHREKLDRAKELGANEVVLVEGGRFAADVLRMTKDRGADVVLELVGGGYVSEDVSCAARGGRVVVVGLLAGPTCDLDLATLLRKRITVVGTVLRSRPLEEKILLARTLSKNLLPLFEAGLLRPIVDRVFTLERAGDAHAHMASNEGFGKTVLET
jgi:putative PIG3 family NAD(P)H quinone oxidoreductase